MKPSIRLVLSTMMIAISALYAVLVVKSPSLASAISSGYVAVLLSVFFLVNFWKKP